MKVQERRNEWLEEAKNNKKFSEGKPRDDLY